MIANIIVSSKVKNNGLCEYRGILASDQVYCSNNYDTFWILSKLARRFEVSPLLTLASNLYEAESPFSRAAADLRWACVCGEYCAHAEE